MPNRVGVMQKLVGYQSPELQSPRQWSSIKLKPFINKNSKGFYDYCCKEYCYINNQQPFDNRRKFRKCHPHLWSITELRLKIVLCVISIVKTHSYCPNRKYSRQVMAAQTVNIVNFAKYSTKKANDFQEDWISGTLDFIAANTTNKTMPKMVI